MTDPETARKQAIAEDVLKRFAEVRPIRAAEIVLAACDDRGLLGCRGICRYGEARPTRKPAIPGEPPLAGTPPVAVPPLAQGLAGASTAHLPSEIQDMTRLPRLTDLRVGEYMHLAVASTFAGYIHMFNIGTSGDVAKLFPKGEHEGQYLPVSRWQYVSEALTGMRRVYQERGPVTGYPERLLAVIVRDGGIPLAPADLYPDWVTNDRRGEGARGQGVSDDAWGVADRASEWFWDLPAEAWQWGLLAVPIALAPAASSGDGRRDG
jgi:hypothetical protein